ncbi:MAG: transcription termination factor Rho [Bacteroidaceae bacterium]|nr:transcription termination factor Rho [Bacteroidaceae bacterium]
MPNFKLEELLSKPIDEIRSIAQNLGLKTKQADSQQDIAYMIIDEQAILNSKSISDQRKTRRPRISNSAQPEEGTPKRKAKEEDKPADASAEKKEADPAAEPKPKRRGRPRKSDTVATGDDSTNKVSAETTSPAVEPEAKPAEPKRKGRPRKSNKTSDDTTTPSASSDNTNKNRDAKPTAIAASLFDEEAANNFADDTDSPEETPLPETRESDFIILQDIPSADLVDSQMADNEQESADETEEEGANEEKVSPDVTPEEDKNSFAMPRRTNQTYDFGESIIGSGVLEITAEGQGYLRSADYNYLTSPDDIFVTPQIIKNYSLKMGDVVEGPVRAPKENEKLFTLLKVTHINGLDPDKVRDRQTFEHLTPLFPDEKFQLCKGDGSDSLSARVVDLFAPIGKGQRALLVAQPKTGKTILMKSIANAIAANHPEAYLMMLLIDERPEEVTDMARTVNAEVIASTFDEPASNHVKIAGIVLEKAKRMVECGHDVVIFLDSITRLARAYNTVAPASGKILTGGVDANALQKPKRFFGAARNIEGGGSLTIIATALIDTGSRMDEVIFEEFKGTGNMELQLDRTLSNKRIFPAVNCVASSTRRDDLLQDESILNRVWAMRNYIAEMTAMEAMTLIKDRMNITKNNEEFLLAINS